MAKRPELSILMPSLRSETAGERIAEYWRTNPDCDYELVVVSPFPLSGPRTVHVKETTPQGPVAAMMAAYERSSAPYVAYVSDDASPGPGSLSRMLDFVKTHTDPFIGAFRLAQRNGVGDIRWHVYGKLFAPWGCVSRKTLESCGGFFDVRFRSFWADPDLSLRIWKAGGKVALCKEAWFHVSQIADSVKSENLQRYFDTDTEHFLNRWHTTLGRRIPREATRVISMRKAGIRGWLNQVPAARLIYQVIGRIVPVSTDKLKGEG